MMNPRPTLTLTLTAAFAVAFLSNSNGVAHQQNKDRTGAPGSDNTCQQCHSGGNFNPVVNAFLITQGEMTLADTYMPGETHTLLVEVSSSGSPSGFGVHGTAVFEDGSNAGTFSDQDATDCIWLDEVNGRHIFEQNDLCSSGSFQIIWDAPEEGSGPVTIYVASIAANGNGTASGDVFGGGSFTFSESVPSAALEVEATPSPVICPIEGGLELTCSQAHETTVLSLDGRVLAEGKMEAGTHIMALSYSGVALVHSMTNKGTTTKKIWIP